MDQLESLSFPFAEVQIDIRPVDPGRWVLVARRIPTYDEAVSLATRLATALVWVAIESDWGIQLTPELGEVTQNDEPAPANSIVAGAEGIAEAQDTLVYPADLKLALVGFGDVSLTRTMHEPQYKSAFERGMQLPSAERTWADPRLRLAVELFLDSFFEVSTYAKFLARINVLEVLKEQSERPAPIGELVTKWQKEVTDLTARTVLTKELGQSVQSSLQRLRSDSIRGAIKALVTAHLGLDQGKRAADLYDLRSELVHNGTTAEARIGTALNEVTMLIRDLLKTLLATPPNSNNPSL